MEMLKKLTNILYTILMEKGKMLYIPMVFMLCATLSSLVLSFKNNVMKLMDGTGVLYKEGLQCVIIVPIVVLAVILVIEGGKVLIQTEKERKAKKSGKAA